MKKAVSTKRVRKVTPKVAAEEAAIEGAEEKARAKKGRTEMMPRRSKPKRVNDPAEADAADAWWVKK